MLVEKHLMDQESDPFVSRKNVWRKMVRYAFARYSTLAHVTRDKSRDDVFSSLLPGACGNPLPQ